MRKGMLAFLAGAGMLGAIPAAQADGQGVHIVQGGPAYLSLGLGAFNAAGVKDIHGYDATLPEFNVEYQSAAKLFGIGAAWGLLANTNGGIMGYGGFYTDVAWDRWVLTPVLAFGGYDQGRGKDLGSIFQFRLELGLAYQLANQARVGVKIAHISNARIVAQDPGENEVVVTYAMPLSLGD